jgi:sulfite exporter TauE/SafE
MMAALGFGTLPLLFFFGTASAALSAKLRGNLVRLVGLFVALIGFVGLWRVLGKMGYVVKFPFW